LQAAQPRGLADDGRQACLDKRAVRAARVVGRRWQPLLPQERLYSADDGDGARSQRVVERDLVSLPGGVVEDGAARRRSPKHVLQTERLRAQLEVGMGAMPLANFIFDGERRFRQAVELHEIGFAAYVQAWTCSRTGSVFGKKYIPARVNLDIKIVESYRL